MKNDINNNSENISNSGFLQNNIPYRRNNIFTILSFVFGIFSVLCCCIWYVGIIASVASIVFFAIDRKKNIYSNSLAIAALVCAITGFLLSLAIFVSTVLLSEKVLDIFISLYEKL